MKSVSTKEFASLPKLDAPAGYICVLRDIDRDAYRIDGTDHPATYVDRLLAELTGNYGIELISILESDDIVASESQLFDSHHARLSDEWIHLDSHQLAELRRSDLQINAHSSRYLRPQSDTPPKGAASTKSVSRYNRPAASYSHASAERTWRRASRSSLVFREEGADARRRRVRLEDIDGSFTLLQYVHDRLQPLREIQERLKEYILDHMLAVLFILFVLAFVIMVFSMKYGSILNRLSI